MKTFTKTAIAATVTAAMIIPASSAFAASKTERAILGAVIGGVAGAAVGNGKTEAVAIGAVAGAALGATTAKKKDYRYGYRTAPRYDNRYYNQRGYQNNRYAYDRYGNRYDARDYGYRR
ncbi:glycine zipper 2TM domain-containing protein [Caulobacter sp.]|uniref:glycine zipper 2TM domain-containing protein n=1 Tax=Caulobacter sp. TaxID=78 RepID=UPI001B2D982A|nr:glycine zipper 2TM domain-containing protein [Caulobacter sp.]MBO9543308.1 glycine zipper 2TM domain-containing protein [Caulobacter sp.]